MSGQGARFALQIVSTMVLARVLTPADFGLVAMVTAITGFLALFKDLGLSTATVQSAEIGGGEVSALFWVNVLVSALLAVLVAGLAPLLAWLYHEPALTGITVATASGFVFSGLGVQHQALLQRQMRFGLLAAVDIGSLTAGIAAGLLLALNGAGYWALVAMPIVTSLTASVGYWVACSWRPGRPVWGSSVKRMLSFGGFLTGFNSVNYFARNADNVLIGWRWGPASLGLYAKAYQLLLLPLQQLNAPTTSVAIPALSRLQDDPVRYRRAYMQVVEKLTLLTIPLVAFLIATSSWVVVVVLGPQWAGANHIFMWLGVSALVQPVTNTTGWLFITQHRTNDMFRWGLIGSALSIASFVVGLPYGAVGVAGAYAISGLVIRTPLLLWFVGRSGPVSARDICRASLRPVLVGGALLAALLVFRWVAPDGWSSWESLLAAAVISVLVMGLFFVFSRLGREALSDLRYLFKRGDDVSR